MYFNPRAPQGARRSPSNTAAITTEFQPTRSAGSATLFRICGERVKRISIHALRRERDKTRTVRLDPSDISIHALRRERDGDGCPLSICIAVFQSTRSAGSATIYNFGDYTLNTFQSTRSAGSATSDYDTTLRYIAFQSTRSAGSATGRDVTERLRHAISIHALRRERDKQHVSTRMCTRHFNPRAPQGARQQKWT